MAFIATTSTAVEKLKREAKTLRKTTGTSLAVALDDVAKRRGYDHWKHVILCQEQTTSLKPLPQFLTLYLSDAAEKRPASTETQYAFAHGFVFAMDVKDAQDISLDSDFVECEDAWYLAAKELWRGLVHYREHDADKTLFEQLQSDELLETVLDDLFNYKFFRKLPPNTPSSLEEAYKQIKNLSFFPPTHIWLGGKFFDVGEIPAIRVDGQVVHSTFQGVTVLSSAVNQQSPRQTIHKLTFDIYKIQPGLYGVNVLSGGVPVTEPSDYNSIEEAIREEASAVPDEFAYYADVLYGGVSSGTMSLSEMIKNASKIADKLVELIAEMSTR